jgi:hypothetical protein
MPAARLPSLMNSAVLVPCELSLPLDGTLTSSLTRLHSCSPCVSRVRTGKLQLRGSSASFRSSKYSADRRFLRHKLSVWSDILVTDRSGYKKLCVLSFEYVGRARRRLSDLCPRAPDLYWFSIRRSQTSRTGTSNYRKTHFLSRDSRCAQL